MTAYFQNGLFRNSRFNDRQQTPYAYEFVRFGNKEKRKTEPRFCRGKKNMQVEKN
jgi:hypothetical protein